MKTRLVLTVLCFLMLAGACWAQGSIRLYLENDAFSDSDQHYTHGTRAVFMQSPSNGFMVGQLIYTPVDTSATNLIPDDRPYAAWLYVGRTWAAGTEEKFGVYEVNVGFIGPEAAGEDTQKAIHKLTGNDIPAGWEHQLESQFALEASYRQMWTIHHEWGEWGIKGRPYLMAALGNVMTFLGAGGIVYGGYNPPSELTSPVIIIKDASSRPSFSAAVFAGVEGRLMLYNKFIEGSDDYTIEKEPWVRDLTFGLHLGWKGFSVSLAQNIRSEEFKEQPEPHRFTSLALKYDF